MRGGEVRDHDARSQSNYQNQNGLAVFTLKRGGGQKTDEGEAGDSRPQAWGKRRTHVAPSLAREDLAPLP